MHRFHRIMDDNRGFTLIEVIATLIVIAILAAIAVNRLSLQPDLTAQADTVKTHLRYAQLKALHDDARPWGIVFSANSYTLYTGLSYDGSIPAAPSAIILPSENSNSHSVSAGVTITTPQTVYFDSWGSPGASNLTITLSQGGATMSITVTGNTGYIP